MSFRAIAFPDTTFAPTVPSSASSPTANPPSTNDCDSLLLVLLHGWGANANDVAAMAPYLMPSAHPNKLSMLFPDAPFNHPMPGGYMWYSIPDNYTFGHRPQGLAQEQLQHSRTRLIAWLQDLKSRTGIPLSRTILAGFSQGGAMAVDVGTRLPLAGLMVLSGYLHDEFKSLPTPLPAILQVHGQQDGVVPLAAALQLRDRLSTLGARISYHELKMGHDIPLTVLELMQSFIQNILTFEEKKTTEML